MMLSLAARFRRRALSAVLTLAAACAAAPLGAQGMQTIDPDSAIDGDLAQPQSSAPVVYDGIPTDPAPAAPSTPEPYIYPAVPTPDPAAGAAQTTAVPAATSTQGETWKEDDLIGAAEGVFGKGAEGLAGLIEDVLAKQGEPNAYIVGREAGGAFILGARYGSGTLYHKVEGQRPVYWTGPSVGFDVGANAGSTFVLVYNLYDTQELYERYPAGEGTAYLVGGFNASYLRKGDVVLIPIRVGAGLRLGVNAGYMKFSEKQRWLPF
ncbi:MAG TPA: EipA family protein [Thermomicrobiales bacterium]|nr:EipA family protein [Thermomicrobiales bacterium]